MTTSGGEFWYSKETMRTDSLPTLDTTKELIDAYLDAYSNRQMQDAERIGPSYVYLRKTINALIQVGGKRLRPHMVLSAFQAYAPEEALESVVPAAVSQELIHLAMLIHDDIIDRDLIRYGIPNVAGQYEEHYTKYIPKVSERQHMALGAALLAGDALITDAHQIIRTTDRPHDLVLRSQDILSRSIFDVIGGELLDMEVGVLPKGSIDPIAVAEHKTSSYSFVGPLTTGAVLAGAPETDIALLAQFGTHLGIGYQLKDDILGVFGDEDKTGKSTTTDITEGKRTFMVQQFEQLATEVQRSEFFAIFHREDITDADIARVRALLRESGAAKATEERMDYHRDQCDQLVRQLAIPDTYREAFFSLMAVCLVRES